MQGKQCVGHVDEEHGTPHSGISGPRVCVQHYQYLVTEKYLVSTYEKISVLFHKILFYIITKEVVPPYIFNFVIKLGWKLASRAIYLGRLLVPSSRMNINLAVTYLKEAKLKRSNISVQL